MPKILAIDSSTESCSVAINDNGVINERYELAPREHTRRLLPMVDDLLSDHGIALAQLDAIAFASGPGSFTGLRIASSMVQGLAFGAELPVISISTLATMARGVYRDQMTTSGFDGDTSVVMCSLDARMSEVYWGVYGFDAQGQCIALSEDVVCSPLSVCLPASMEVQDKHFFGVGSGWGLESEFEGLNIPTDSQNKRLVLIDTQRNPHAEDVAWLAKFAFERNEVISPENAVPVYLRNTVSWKKRQRLRS